jgi:sirohydrochlorin cobaltochelatase
LRDLPLTARGKKVRDAGDPALLIVGHGSRDPRGAREFHELVSLVRDRAPIPVEGGS